MGNIRENGLVKYFYSKKKNSRKAQKKICKHAILAMLPSI